jgi:hypothetical protein
MLHHRYFLPILAVLVLGSFLAVPPCLPLRQQMRAASPKPANVSSGANRAAPGLPGHTPHTFDRATSLTGSGPIRWS